MKYVGARYVPKFMGAYDNTQAYEALCVVDNGSGTSYITIKPTPAGTTLTDTNYWAIYGASSGAIINLQNQIDDINDDITLINRTIGSPRKVICIGDSYLGGSGRPYAENESWGAFLRFLLNNGSNTIIKGYGGTGFIGQSTVLDHNYLAQLTEAFNEMTADERAAVTDIVVQGGLNDAAPLADGSATELDLQTAIATFVSYAHTNFPNAIVRLADVGWATDGLSNKTTWYKVLNVFKTFLASDVERFQYIQGCVYVMPSLNNSFYADNVHPNTTASYMIAKAIYNGMNGGNGSLGRSYMYDSVPITPEGDITVTNNALKFSLADNVATIHATTLWLASPTSIDFTFGNFTKLADIDASVVPIRASEGFEMPCSIYCLDSNTFTTGLLRFKNKAIYLRANIGAAGLSTNNLYIQAGSGSASSLIIC